jgi:hypothetical protein
VCGDDHTKLHDWMAANGLSHFMPTRYFNKADVVYPAVVKGSIIPGTDAREISVVYNKPNLDGEIAKVHPGHPVLIEEVCTMCRFTVQYFKSVIYTPYIHLYAALVPLTFI